MQALVLGVILALLASPVNLLLLRMDWLPGPVPLALVLAVDVAATLLLGRVLGSLCRAALVVAVLDLPLLFLLGTAESGPWASVLATPKYIMQAALAWAGWARSKAGWARWASVCVATGGALVAIASWLP